MKNGMQCVAIFLGESKFQMCFTADLTVQIALRWPESTCSITLKRAETQFDHPPTVYA